MCDLGWKLAFDDMIVVGEPRHRPLIKLGQARELQGINLALASLNVGKRAAWYGEVFGHFLLFQTYILTCHTKAVAEHLSIRFRNWPGQSRVIVRHFASPLA